MNNELFTNKICNHLSKLISSGELNNHDLVQIIEHIGGYLNLQTISDYSKSTGISYNGAKKFRSNIELFGVKFIVDNI